MKVSIVQSKIEQANQLEELFSQRGDGVSVFSNAADFFNDLSTTPPDLVVLDLHSPEGFIQKALKEIQQNHAKTKLLVTSWQFELNRELEIKKYGSIVILRAPLTRSRLEHAINHLDNVGAEIKIAHKAIRAALPKVKTPIQLKIIIPYLLLSLLLVIGAGYFVSRVALDTIEDRFVNNLIEMGRLASAWMVEEENQRIESLRLIANTEGLAWAIQNENAEELRELTYGIALNTQEESIVILDHQGQAILSLHHIKNGDRQDYEFSKGDPSFADLALFQNIILGRVDTFGNKYADLINTPRGDYIYIAGPILNNENQLAGVALVGRSLSNLVFGIRTSLLGEQNTFANITVYALDGKHRASTLLDPSQVSISAEVASTILERQSQESLMRTLVVSDIDYREILGPWEVRNGIDLGLMGIALAEHFLIRPNLVTQLQIFIIATLSVIMVIAIGFYVAGRITGPLTKVVAAASHISQGRWDISVEPQSQDELGFLAHAFNYMTSHLREGEIYRDLLGRTITPQIRDQLRSGIRSGQLKLVGQNTVATVMITDIRDFTIMSEGKSPTTILNWLDQYFGELVPIITNYGGFVHEFAGDSLKAVFGVLPQNLSAQESAYQACQASIEMIHAIHVMNARRKEHGEPPLKTGIGINTGVVAAGGMGSLDRLHYAIIGDTVNITQRIEGLTKCFDQTVALLGYETYAFLGALQKDFQFELMGSQQLKGVHEPLDVYRLLPRIQQPFIDIDDRKVSAFS